MLILLLSLLFLCDLRCCVKFNEPLCTEHVHRWRRNDNFKKYSITDVLLNTLNSTPEIHQTERITPQYSALTTPLGNETNPHDDPSYLPCPSSPFLNDSSVPPSPKLKPMHKQVSGLKSLSPSSPHNMHPTLSTTVNTTYILNPTGVTSEETTSSSPNVERSFVSVTLPEFGLDPVSYPAETPPINFDPSVAEFAMKWLQGIASTTANTTKSLIPKLSKIFDYDHTIQRFPRAIRRDQKKPQRKISNRQLKNNALRHKTRPISRQGVTVPQISKRKNPESEANTFWHDPPTEPTTAIKQRLKPALLLGKATISAVRNTEDVEGNEMKPSGSDGRERIMRMHYMSVMTKKQWYSDRTKVPLEQLETTTPTAKKQFLKHIISSAPTTHFYMSTASTTQTYLKMAETMQPLSTMKDETRPEGYMMVFLTELMRLIATKEKKAVHDVLKHTDQIIHGLYKSGKLQWFGRPSIDVTRKLARILKTSEIDIIQKQAAGLQHSLSQRRQMLSDEVNTILESAGSLYDDDEGGHLLEVLNEFAVFPNITLSGYWLCNSLINNFLRPYRRLTDTRQRQQLMDSVNNALKTRFTSSGSNETTALRSGGVRQADVPPDEQKLSTHTEPPSGTTRTPGKRKRKHHHRSRKRKRERKRYRMHRYRNRERGRESLMLRSMAPRTSVQPSV